MLEEVNSKKYKKDTKLLKKQGKDKHKLNDIIEKLKNKEILDIKYKDHSLDGDWKGFRDCHIEPDWILIYRIDEQNNLLYLARTGSHAHIFNESIFTKLNNELKTILNE